MLKRICYVIPCYNEEDVIEETVKRVLKQLSELTEDSQISKESKILLVDDGSGDNTWKIIKNTADNDKRVCALKLSRNFGHQNALLAGLMWASKFCDGAISMDADLQDDINAARLMLDEYKKGNNIVFGVRSTRKKDKLFKRISAELFYKIMRFMGVNVIFNHADYRLMDKKAIEALAEYPERNLFLRGMVADLGFKSSVVYYERGERYAGKSKYPLRKMLSFAGDGITSFTIKPLKLASLLAVLSLLVSVVMLCYCIVQKIKGETVPGWSSLGASIWAVGGLELFMVGIIGEYIGKIYFETKKRPRYIVDETINVGEDEG